MFCFYVIQAFLSKYVDKTALSRRRSQSEDDHPPSPTMEHTTEPSPSHFLGHSRSAAGASPAGQQRGDIAGRFHPMTPSGFSNPHTPASPHMGNISQVKKKKSNNFHCTQSLTVGSAAGPVTSATWIRF